MQLGMLSTDDSASLSGNIDYTTLLSFDEGES